MDPIGIIRAVFRNIISGNATAQGEHHYAAAGAKRFPFAGTDAETQDAGGFLALKIERQYTKKEILEMYMNQIYFGQAVMVSRRHLKCILEKT